MVIFLLIRLHGSERRLYLTMMCSLTKKRRYGCSAQTLRNIYDNKQGYGTFVTFIILRHIGQAVDQIMVVSQERFPKHESRNINILYNKINKEIRYGVHRKNKRNNKNLRYFWKALEDHLPASRMRRSEAPLRARSVARPTLKEWVSKESG